MPMPAPFHVDSETEDDYEAGLLSPYLTGGDGEGNLGVDGNLIDASSAEPTPTKQSHEGLHYPSPGSRISGWSKDQVAVYIRDLGLKQYCESFLAHFRTRIIKQNVTVLTSHAADRLENEISGESLVALRHDELKEMGIMSVGHRLTILKGIFDVKLQQGVPLDAEDYKPPSAEASVMDQSATMSDILRLIQSLELRDRRIQATEAGLCKVTDEYRRLRDELLPVFRSHKNNSQPLPYHPEKQADSEITSPLPSLDSKQGSGSSILSRKFSTKRLLLGSTSTPKTSSPTHVPPQGTEERFAAEDAPSASLLAPNLLSQRVASPRSLNIPSPTSPSQYHRTQHPQPSYSTRSYPHIDEGHVSAARSAPLSSQASLRRTVQSAAAPAPLTSLEDSNSATPGVSREGANSDIFKSFRLDDDDPCEKVLAAAVKKYNIDGNWKDHALYIAYGDQERCLGLREKPLAVFKQLAAENRKPTFMLRKHAAPMEGHSGPSSHTGSNTDYIASSRGYSGSIQLPGGVL